VITIWKFKLSLAERQFVQMPAGARILSAGEQADELYLWAIVDDTTFFRQDRVIVVKGTGHDFRDEDDALSFIGTVQMRGTPGNRLVWHVFESLREVRPV
jgi:hypothetical protein